MQQPLPIFRIRIDDLRVGTGFLVNDDFVVTAFHVVGNRKTGVVASRITLEIPESGQISPVQFIVGDPVLDFCVLQITGELAGFKGNSLVVRDIPPRGAERVEIVGYPIAGKGKRIILNGTVSGSSSQQKFETDLLVQSQQLSINEKFDYRGMSGGPVLFNGQAIGILRWQMLDEESEISPGICFCTLFVDIFDRNPSLRSRLHATHGRDPLRARILDILRMFGYRVFVDVDYRGIRVPILAIQETVLEKREVIIGYTTDQVDILNKCVSKGVQSVIYIMTDELPSDLQNHANISVKSYTELANNLLDFHAYIQRYIHDYENYSSFVNQSGVLIRYPIVDSLAQFNTYKYFVADYLLCNRLEHGVVIDEQNLVEYVNKWLLDDSRNYLLLLGDYGIGKTSFCLDLTYRLALKFQNDQVLERIPLFVSLRDYPRFMDWQRFITDTLVNQYGVKVDNFIVFQRFIESGKIVLILDGFDEMSNKSNRDQTIQTFEDFVRTIHPGAKTIVTCRTHYFLDQSHIDHGVNTERTSELFHIVQSRPDFEIVQMREFNESQILSVLQRYRPDDWQFAWVKIKNIYNLALQDFP